MTKVTELGKNLKNESELKPIEFVKCLEHTLEITKMSSKPSEYDNIILLCKDYASKGYDLMFAYDDEDRDRGALVLGQFNDGIV